MSEIFREKRESDSELKKFAEIIISQNEAVNRLNMQQNESTRKALDGVISQIERIASSHAALLDSQSALLNSHVEHKKDLEYINKRAERQDESITKLISELDSNNKITILLEERTKANSNNWSSVGAIVTSVVSAGAIAFWVKGP